MLILPALRDCAASENLHSSGRVFTPMDDRPWHLSIPLNPGWIPEELGDGWVLESDGYAPPGMTARFRRFEVRKGKRGTATRSEETVAEVPLDRSVPLSGSFTASFASLSGYGMADESFDLSGLRLRRSGYVPPEPTVGIHVMDYPGKPLWRRLERGLPFRWNPPTRTAGETAFFRCRGESMTGADLERALADEASAVKDGLKIVNPPSLFHLSNEKDRAFSIWKAAGLATPEWTLFDPDDPGGVVDDFLERHGCCLARLNDDACSRSTYYLSINTDSEQTDRVMSDLSKDLSVASTGRPWSKAMLVSKIQPEEGARLLHARAFIAGGKCVCVVPMYSNAHPNMFAQWPARTIDLMMEDCGRCERVAAEHGPMLAGASAMVGCDASALDVLVLLNGKIVLLEANSYWGMGAGSLWPYSDKMRLEIVNKLNGMDPDSFLSTRLRLDEWSFWKAVYKIIGKIE